MLSRCNIMIIITAAIKVVIVIQVVVRLIFKYSLFNPYFVILIGLRI